MKNNITIFRTVLILLALVSNRIAFGHDEPSIIRDVTVIDYEGNPVDGTEVFVLCSQFEYSGDKTIHKQVAEAVTNSLGQVRVQWPTEDKSYYVFAYKPGLALGRSLETSWNPRRNISLQLGKVVPLSGTVIDEEGRPIMDAKVQINPYTMDLPFLATKNRSAGPVYLSRHVR